MNHFLPLILGLMGLASGIFILSRSRRQPPAWRCVGCDQMQPRGTEITWGDDHLAYCRHCCEQD